MCLGVILSHLVLLSAKGCSKSLLTMLLGHHYFSDQMLFIVLKSCGVYSETQSART